MRAAENQGRFKVWERAFDALDQACRYRFRHPEGLSEWLMRYWYLAEGEYSPRSRSFGRYFEIKEDNTRMLRCIERQEVKMICCNDTSKVINFERARSDLEDALRSILPDKSSFES